MFKLVWIPLQSPFVWLLERPLILGRLTILATLIPMLFIQQPILEIPMLFAGIMLFTTVNWTKITQVYTTAIGAHIWLKIQYFWFIVGALVVATLFFSTLVQIIDPFFFISALYLITYIIWFNNINTLLTERGEELILKGNTTTQNRNIDFEDYLLPLTIGLLIVFLIISLESIRITRARSIFVIDTIYWVFPLVIMLVHYIIDALFREQIIWQPEGGITEYRPLSTLPQLPDPHNPVELASYFAKIRQCSTPPEGIFEMLEENMEYLVERAQDISYLPFQINLVHAMGNWGKHSRDYLHILLMIILASVSRYRIIGLIPLYKRSMFYSALQIIPMSGSMTYQWRELFQYEVIEKKDRYHVLDWIVGAPYLDSFHRQNWVRTWNGKIYKGKEGYYEIIREMENSRQLPPDLTSWQRDIWNLCLEFAAVFIGEQGRQIMTKEVGLYDKLIYLARGHTAEDYQELLIQRQEQLSHPSQRFVYSEPSKDALDLSEKEKREIVRSYLDVEEVEIKTPQLGSIIFSWFSSIKATLLNLKLGEILQVMRLILLFAINVLIIYAINQYIWPDVAAFLIVVQVMLMFILAITPSNADLKLDEDRSRVASTLHRGTMSYKAININTASSRRGYFNLIYALALLFCIQIFVS